MGREVIEDSDTFVTEVCWHYYINGNTQAEVARILGVTRLRVNQAIQRAKASGMVRIEIDSPFLPRIEMQHAVEERFGIKRAVIAPASRDAYDFHGTVGAALASHVSERLRAGAWTYVGVSWGMTLERAIHHLERQSYPDLEVVSVLGGTSHGTTFNAFGIASGLAEILGARYSILTAPIYLSEDIDTDLFLSQYMLREHFEKFDRLDAVILTCSNISEKSFLVAYGLPKEITTDTLTRSGAIGDVLGHFLDADGNSVSPAIDARTIGMPLEAVRKVPEKIMAAAGPHKVPILCAALATGLVDTLVTDDVTAELLLEATT